MQRFERRDRPLHGCVAALLTVAACGPSFQAVYEGNARFEHCYALDENPQLPMKEKGDCWRDWSERYTFGQTRDRIHYAISRYVALTQAPQVPTDEAMMMAAPGMTPRVSAITAPLPTNAFEPPPKVLGDAGPVSPPLRPSEIPRVVTAEPALVPTAREELAPPPLPDSACGDQCSTKIKDCRVSCATTDGGRAKGRCAACETDYRACMRACFR